MLTKFSYYSVLRSPKPAEIDYSDPGWFLRHFAVTPYHLEQEEAARRARRRIAVIERFLEVCQCMTRELEQEIAQHPHFYDTDYWLYVRDYVVLIRGTRCERCKERSPFEGDTLHVHHRSYNHKGAEWRHLEDLEALCAGCHKREHFG